ncbi:MAG: DUF3971 domain-containing protein, partial [Gallionella sp.]
MLNSLPVRLLWHSLNWLTRLAVVTSAVTAALCAITIIVLRYWLLPDIEQFHDRLTSSLTTAMGNPVSIGKITGDWNGLHPHLNFTDVRLLDSQGQPALVLPGIDASVSWLSLLAAELRLASLEIDRPELLIRRDKQGRMFIGSIALSSGGADNDFANWLLHQSRMVVRNAVIVWLDEQHDAPPLVLDQVNLRIENLFSHHQFALRAVPPIELATPLDVRGDFHGRRFDDLSKWRGQLYTQLDYTDLLAWRPWLKLPDQLSRGRGALRGWLDVTHGQISGLTVDMALHDVATRLSDTVPEMDVHYLSGRAAWKMLANGWEISTRHPSMRLRNGLQLQPTDFYLKTTVAGKNTPATGELRANLLQLETLVSLANFLPLDTTLRSQLNTYAPRGHVSDLDVNWRGTAEKLTGYQIKGQFENLAMHQSGSMPGFSGLSGTIDGTDAFGHLYINTRNLTLDAPGVMREPLLFHTLTGQAEWQKKQGEMTIRADNVAIANDDLAGNINGNFQTRAGTLGILDMTIGLTRGDIRRAARYTPLVALDKKQNDWLNEAMLSGHTEDFHLHIRGNLSDFPLNGSTDALFEMGAHAQGVAVKFAPDWPHIENISGELLMRGNKLEVKAPTATMLGAQLHNLNISLPDMRNADMPLEIKGDADAANSIFLQFIQQSPVRGYINEFTDGMNATGNGHLNLFTRISLNGTKPAQVSGSFRVQGSDMDLGAGVPLLRNTRGELAFTESGMHASSVTADILGGPAHLNVQTTEDGAVHASLQGRTNIDVMRKTEINPLLNFLRGGTAWDANISVVKKTAQVVLNSNLQGISSTLPAPLTKSANEIWPLHIEKKNIADGQDMITAQLGKLVRARLMRTDENGVNVIKRGVISFGGQEIDKPSNELITGDWATGQPGRLAGSSIRTAPSTELRTGPSAELITSDLAVGQSGRLASSSIRTGPSAELRTGVWLTGNLPTLSLQGWDGLAAGSGSALPIAGANLHIDKLTGYGASFNDLQINAAKRGDGLAAQLSGTALNGEVIWQPQGFNGSSKLSAHLRNLYVQDDAPAKP